MTRGVYSPARRLRRHPQLWPNQDGSLRSVGITTSVACAVVVDDGAGGGRIELPCKACGQALVRHSLYLARGAGLDHYAEAASLLVEVDADVVPGLAPSVEIGVRNSQTTDLPRTRRNAYSRRGLHFS